MENVYKIKIKSNPGPVELYPSERRYSATTILGLSIVHLCLALTALLMASLTLKTNEYHQSELQRPNINVRDEVLVLEQGNISQTRSDVFSNIQITDPLLPAKQKTKRQIFEDYVDYVIPNISIAPCILALGGLAAGLAGLLAWKRWYIDNNIKWFFIMTCFATILSAVAVVTTAMTMFTVYDGMFIESNFPKRNPTSFRLVLVANILIAGVLELSWSILSVKIGYLGMINSYPDDIILSKNRGKLEVSTVHRGNKKGKIIPPDIINNFPLPNKFSKYLPQKEDDNSLPKLESPLEYQERVSKFLESEGDNISVNDKS